ncbi:MAG: thioredoxin TrxA [Alphaproteobacteria bacterium]|nr:thioredoxin TrxA [Alphaproteobacteria bacterium]
MSQAVKQISDSSFDADVISASGPVLVDFWATWCGPCKMIGPVLETLAVELQGKVTITKLNVDENPGKSGEYGIRSIPTLMLFKDGKVVSTKIGSITKQALQAWILENA